ncbi:ATP/GTP-binding protein [Streptomyces sp. cg36]|uniref:ATP/GTP-binding protein n=1 Tax=Streptomyces sp. cg36 TaxID=3238798 RepID=UPI0034E2B9C3
MLFSANHAHWDANEAFTNRQAQWHELTMALTQHLQRIGDPHFDAEDIEAPRRNILVFHGVGGIGKTTLSRKIEASLLNSTQRPPQWGEPPWPTLRIVPVRINLARSSGTDFERVILTIRLALASLGRPLPAFDLALRRYWEHAHPGEPLEDYLRRNKLTTRFGKALPQQIQSALSDVAQALLLPGTVGSAAGQLSGALVKALRERRQTVRALAACSRLADILQADCDWDALSYYPHLLAWELAHLPPKQRALPVILLDTFEEIGDRTHRETERLIQRLVWLLPNAFFVITGRNRLQWADDRLQGQLDWTGPTAWPDLASPDPVYGPLSSIRGNHQRQVLIGDFSHEDCHDYLTHRLSDNGQPLISSTVRRVIADRSQGLPLFLDIAVMRFLEIHRTGREPQPSDFTVDFPALITRTLHGLTPDERHVLRTVSLLDAFDIPLAAKAAGLRHQAAAARLTERPFIRENTAARWPFHLHALIRSTIRHADDQSDDRWTPDDWKQAAQHTFDALGEQWTLDRSRDRSLLIACLRQGLSLAREFSLALGWLTEAAWAYVADAGWEPLTPAGPPSTPPAPNTPTAADMLAETLHALARRQHEHRTHTVERLTAVIRSHRLPDDLEEAAIYYLAKAHRDLGHTQESRRGMQRIASGGGRLAPAARRGLAHLSRLAGDFPATLEIAQSLGWEGRHHRIAGDVWWAHGDMQRASEAFQAARQEAEDHNVAGEAATCQAMRALALAFLDPNQADDELQLAQHLVDHLDLRATQLTIEIATLARDAGTDQDIDDRARLLRTEIDNAGLITSRATLEVALAFHHTLLHNHNQYSAAVTRIQQLIHNGNYQYFADIAHFMSQSPAPTYSTTHWINSPHTPHQRWQHHITTRRAHLNLTP